MQKEQLTPPLLPNEWKDPEYRQAYMEAAITQGIAWQIRINREKRGWTQEDLAHHAGLGLTTIETLEDTEVDLGFLGMPVLRKIAHAFGIVLRVDFTDYHTLAESSEHLSEDDLYIEPVSFE